MSAAPPPLGVLYAVRAQLAYEILHAPLSPALSAELETMYAHIQADIATQTAMPWPGQSARQPQEDACP